MRLVSRAVVGAIACLTLCAVSNGALGAEDPEALISQGVALRKAGQDARAEGYFLRAYQLAATSRTAAQLGLVELALSDYLKAEAHLSEALTAQDAWIVQNAKTLEESRNVARKNLLRVELVGAPRDATFRFEDTKPRPLPTSGTFWSAPDRPSAVWVEAPGYRTMNVLISGGAGQVQRVVVVMPPLVAPTEASSPSVARDEGTSSNPASTRGRALRIAGITTAAVGVASCALGLLFYEQGTTKLNDYQAAIRSDGTIPWNPADQDWETKRHEGIGFLIAGGVAAAAGVSLFLVGNHAEANEAGGGKLSFASGSGFAFLSYRGSF